VERQELARTNGYPDEILSQLLEFERAVREEDLTGAVLKTLYERGAPIYNVGFRLPTSLRFVEFLQCLVSDGLAVSWELWDATVETSDGDHVVHGRSTEVWRRQDDGTWKMAYDHASIAVELELALQATADVVGMGGTRPAAAVG
jgi:hypothetical protein